MGGEQLASQARDIWQQVSQSIPGQTHQQELQQTMKELTGRVEFVTTGKQPEPTQYSGLDATALAHQTRAVVSRVARELPIDQREQLDIVQALADRIEVAGAGSPATMSSFKGSQGNSF